MNFLVGHIGCVNFGLQGKREVVYFYMFHESRTHYWHVTDTKSASELYSISKFLIECGEKRKEAVVTQTGPITRQVISLELAMAFHDVIRKLPSTDVFVIPSSVIGHQMDGLTKGTELENVSFDLLLAPGAERIK